MPPFDLDAERGVLSACSQSPDAVDCCIERLDTGDFYLDLHQRIWQAIVDLCEQGATVDSVTIPEAIRKRYGECDVVSVIEVCAAAVGITGLRAHMITLEDRTARRVWRELGHTIESSHTDLTVDPTALRERIEQDIQDRLQVASRGVSSSLDEMLDGVCDEIDEAVKRGGALQGKATGLRDWDELMTEGGYTTGMHVLAAGTSQGKTALALQVALHRIKAGDVVVFFALEMTRRALMFRLLSMESGVGAKKLKRGLLTERDWQAIRDASNRLRGGKLHCIDQGGLTPSQMRAQLRRLQRQHGLDFVVVDYLQLMSYPGDFGREQEVAKISRSLKAMSTEFDVPFLTLAQLSRKHEERRNPRPILSDLRESGSIEQDSDSVTFIFQPSRYNMTSDDGTSLECVAQLLIRKQRDGEIGDVLLNWSPSTTTFRCGKDMPPQREYPQYVEPSTQTAFPESMR